MSIVGENATERGNRGEQLRDIRFKRGDALAGIAQRKRWGRGGPPSKNEGITGSL